MLVPLFASLWKPSRALSFAAVENVSLVGSGVVLYSFNGDNTNLLICAAIFVSVEKAASRTLTSVIEKQQTVIQSQSSRELSRANASLVRLDLIVAAFANGPGKELTPILSLPFALHVRLVSVV